MLGLRSPLENGVHGGRQDGVEAVLQVPGLQEVRETVVSRKVKEPEYKPEPPAPKPRNVRPRLDPELVARIDKIRGDVPLERWVRGWLEEVCDRIEGGRTA